MYIVAPLISIYEKLITRVIFIGRRTIAGGGGDFQHNLLRPPLPRIKG